MGSEENTIVAVAVAGGSAADDAAANTDRFNVPVAPIHVSRPKAYEDAPAFGADATGVGAAGKCRPGSRRPVQLPFGTGKHDYK